MPERNKLLSKRFSEASLRRHLARILLFSLLLSAGSAKVSDILSLAQGSGTRDQNRSATRGIKEGTTIIEELSKQATQAFEIELPAEQYVNLIITKGDLSISATVFGPQDELLNGFVSRRYEPVRVSFISERAGRYRLEVRSLEMKDMSARYELKVEMARPATPEDRKISAAVRSFAEADKLASEWQEPALRAAILKYTEALELWESASRQNEAAETLESIGDIYFALSEYHQALEYYRRAYKAGQLAHDRRAQTRELNNFGYVYNYLGQASKALGYSAKALDYYSRARARPPDVEDQRGEAKAHNIAGEAHYNLGKLRQSIDSFDRALALWKAANDRNGQALAKLNIGYAYSDSGDLKQAQQHFSEALSLWREIGDRRGEALALTAIGTVHSFLGEKQMALDNHAQAMSILRVLGNREGEAVALNSIGKAYEDLNEPLTALDNYNRALQIYKERGHGDFEAVTRYYIGRVYNSLGDKERALEFYRQSMLQSRQAGQQRLTAYALTAISTLRSSEGNRQEALSQLNKALKLYRSIGDRRGQLNTLNNVGQIYYSLGEKKKALRYYQQALPLSRAAGDRNGEATTLYNIARAERDLGILDEALSDIEASLKTIESLRAQIVSPSLRASYFASVQKHFELYIDLLMRIHKERPDKRFAALALQAGENARARALIEILAEASAHIRQGVDPNLLERERSLQQMLSAKAAYQMSVLGGNADAKEVEKAAKEIRQLTTAYEEVETEIKQQSPSYAALVQPQPLKLEDIQAQLRDSDTLLLEYALGDERSYLWAVTSNSFAAYELPGRAKIEGAVVDLYKLLTARQAITESGLADYQGQVASADDQYWKEAAKLSQMLLGPLASQLDRKRLLIVADGALQYLPFDALPKPVPRLDEGSENKGTDSLALVLDHEIVTLPSASTLAVIRRGEPSREPGEKVVAILADPVFERDDPRVHTSAKPTATTAAQSTTVDTAHRVLRDIAGPNELANISRLPATRQEAEAIMALTPSESGMMATDFNACRTTAMSGQLGRYRVVHFATHSIINTEHPELSGVILSLMDEQGKSEDGFLQLHDIYNLDLSETQLVVLSACRTGLGKDVKGEGLIGLTRGFMYAGSRSVVASLWKVDDRATAELMKNFYEGMFKEGLTPATALRKAKETMWKQPRWHAPYFWAAFVLQGEYRDVIRVPHANRVRSRTLILMIVIVIAVSVGMIYLTRRRRRIRETNAASC